MADPDPSPELKGPTVAACANECLESFQQCLISASSVHPREASMVEDQVARFSSWASNIGVFAPGSASMDHRLRYASEVQSVVTGLLESLNYRVQTSDASTTANDRLGQSFLDIAAEITRLNKISNTIRRASKDTQVLKASNFQIKDDEGENAEPLLLSHFEHHIGDWFPGISENIRQRLARAMLLRRKRILYRRHRQGNTSIRSENTISQTSVTLPDAQPGAGSSLQTTSKKKDAKAAISRPASKVAPSQVKSATTLAPEKFKMVSSSPSVVSASRTIASGKHQVLTYPPAPGFAAKQRYEKLKSQRIVEAAETSTEPGLRELLESDLQAIGEITCPYCLYALPAAEVFDERKWQNHVKNDLDPYVCLFEDCDQPDVLYTHSDEWLGHLHQHGKVWRCPSHREMGPFSTLEEYTRHMREVHDTKLSDRQLRVVANRNSRKATKLFQSCPLCGREESEVEGRLEDHLAGHLRSLALKSLPSYQDEIPDDVEDGNNSIDGSRPRSRSTIREMEEEKEILQDGAGSFWDHWTPQLAQDVSVNFLGDVYLELDLEDMDVRVASLFFDTMVFKESSQNLDDDPILQSLLRQQLIRVDILDPTTEYSSDPSVEEEEATSSKAPVGETSGQAEVDDAISQQPVNVEPSHAQTTTSGQDTEVEIPKRDQITETLIRQMTQTPPPTEFEILADPESVNLSNPPMDETSRQDEVDTPGAQDSADAEAAHFQPEPVGKHADVIFPEGSKDPEPEPTAQSRPGSEPDLLALLEQAELSPGFKEEATRLAKEGKEVMQRYIDARGADAEAVATVQTVDGVDEGDVVNEENTEERVVVVYETVGFLDKVKRSRLIVAKDRFRDKPEVYEEFIDILKTFKFERTPVQDVEAQISALFEPTPDLWEEFKPFLPKPAPSTEPDSQTKQDARPQKKEITCPNVVMHGHCPDKDQRCEFNHDDDTDSVSQTTQPPGAPLIGSMSPDENDDPPDLERKRESGVYVDEEKVMDLKRRERPLTKHQSSSSPLRKVPGGSSSSQIPPRPGVASAHQESAASAPQAWNPVLPREWASIPGAQEDDLSDGNYHPYPLPQSAPFKPPPPPSQPYPDDAFEADVEDDIPRPKNPRRKTRPGVHYNGQYFESSRFRDFSRENSPVASRHERIVIVDSPPTPRTAPNALGRRPVIVDERPRPRVEIEIVDGSQPRRRRYASDIPSSTRSLNEESTHPRHASEAPRSVRSLNDEYAEREKRRQRRRESKRQEEADERLRARINKANAEISGRPPVPVEPLRRSSYRRPAVQVLDPETDPPDYIRWGDIEREEEAPRRAAKEEGQENRPSVGEFDREEELIKAVLRLESEQKRYKEEARRLSQKEEGKGKENEGEGKQPEVRFPNREAELKEALRQLKSEQDRLDEKARRQARKEERDEREEDEIQRRRLMERMMPRDRSSAGTGSRRHRVLYDEGTYRYE
ncbi:uncharacterized protein NECHADRAFT_86789 [Fusarium vanettenii 77-13-4]|uniref:C3H1-type domain-containing protein n=1 Tax=Fusarium vanettenii (strain ATCC MYA-4622 / CBS 123669 / FGSC 9596 / NRRL 45880 / 77-13-4) TaxID=660122 RepID=C7ZK27_FUSV7|nr:uncharacterized protein NECHADRAFT_86789 [Fusarium vanettenii 77-13-4]EEU35605.1 hypothetical protein NECHADRAFT_86789 [Fusarium vanettenii 77-13-4]